MNVDFHEAGRGVRRATMRGAEDSSSQAAVVAPVIGGAGQAGNRRGHLKIPTSQIRQQQTRTTPETSKPRLEQDTNSNRLPAILFPLLPAGIESAHPATAAKQTSSQSSTTIERQKSPVMNEEEDGFEARVGGMAWDKAGV